MKSITLIIMLAFSLTLFSQQTSPPTVNTDYLKKSKTQKTIGWVLAGGGTVTALVSLTSFNFFNVIGTIIDSTGPGGRNIKRGETAFYIGCIAALSSIPFFIASSKNKKKAASLSFKIQRIPGLQKQSFVYQSYPALSLKIPIQ